MRQLLARAAVGTAALAAFVTLSSAPASADLITDDPLHGYCGGTGQCIDNHTNSPTSQNPPSNFGFTISPASSATGDFTIDILVPDNDTLSKGAFVITGTGQPATGTKTTEFSTTTAWTSGDLDTYLGISASPNNPIGAFLPSTQTYDPSATGFYVYQADLGTLTLNGSSNPNVSPLWNTGAMPQGSYIVGFLTEADGDIVATANSGAIFETGTPGGGGGSGTGGGPVPEPSTLLTLATALLGLGYVMRRSAR